MPHPAVHAPRPVPAPRLHTPEDSVLVLIDDTPDRRPADGTAVQGMVQAGVVRVTWLEVLSGLHRDWARAATAAVTRDVEIEHAGAYGPGSACVTSMFGQQQCPGAEPPEAPSALPPDTPTGKPTLQETAP